MPSPGAGSVTSLSYMAQFLRSKNNNPSQGIVNLSGRGMLVVSVARQLGLGNSFARLLCCPAKAERGGKRRPGSAKLTMPPCGIPQGKRDDVGEPGNLRHPTTINSSRLRHLVLSQERRSGSYRPLMRFETERDYNGPARRWRLGQRHPVDRQGLKTLP
jgi:hypothetical protein